MEISAGARWPACLELPQPLSSSSFGPTAGCSCSCTAGHRASLATGRRASLAAGRRALAPSRCFGPLVVREKQKKQTNKKRGRRKKIRRRENGKWVPPFYKQLNSFLLNSIPIIVTVVSSGVYSLLRGSGEYHFPHHVVNGKVSFKRLGDLLLAEERILLPNPSIDPELPAISIKNG
ncbi:uncharacterized protein LOC107303450 isoform X3 [Oryza brachyantha]|uniref:uncharacterized protein LOC107303450 isoform X3 n=1 Tax=Oryza brachyantha TaxID=4533 RepID=UPI0007761D70|nr:uncharacterized protein LOC107303450 isoform X3 [Oryza brachyantha]